MLSLPLRTDTPLRARPWMNWLLILANVVLFLVQRAPGFAEAYNQRAILHFETEEWYKSIADCERVLELNPYHFGAAAGLGRCYLELNKQRAALKAFRRSLRINPGLDDVEQAIRSLENALGEEGRRDDKR